MTQFIARVEMYGANAEDYENLHERLQSVGYTRAIISGTGRRLKLPDATYYLNSSSINQPETVATQVRQIAQSIRNSAVFVCRFDSWYGYLHDA
ncbi:hypothetical protein ACU6Q5_16760 [Enterobacter sp. CCM 8629]|uniref:hypothetical protein n=1 Tax=Enterobacter hormaechei TaxID=158836 RepID=UPI0037DCEDF1